MTNASPEERWVQRLSSSNVDERDKALADLREVILRGLSHSLNRSCRGFQIEDVVQEALLKIMKALDQFEGRSRFTTWAMTIATRVGLSELRRKQCKDISLEGITAGDSLKIDLAVAQDSGSENHLDQRAILSQLQELIDNVLTDKQRLAIRGLLEGLPVEEIAHRAGSNRNAVYKLVHDARSRLKEGFRTAGIEADDINSIFSWG